MSSVRSIELYCQENSILSNLTIELNTTCNLNCCHCYIPYRDNSGYTTKEVFMLVDEFHELGGLNVILTGGEIFLREDILEIIEYIRNKHMRISVISNAVLLDGNMIEALKKNCIMEFGVSLYSLESTIHDAVTGVNGSFDKTYGNIMALKQAGIQVTIKMPVMSINKNDVADMIKFAKTNNFDYEITTLISPKLNGDNSTKQYQLNDEDIRSCIEIMYTKSELEDLKQEIKFDKNPCMYCLNSIYIDAYKNLYPCNSYYKKLGSWPKDSLTGVWNNSNTLRMIRNFKYSDITECTNCEYTEFCSLCPGISLEELGNDKICSPQNKLNARLRKEAYHSKK